MSRPVHLLPLHTVRHMQLPHGARSGFLLVEVMLGITLFGMFVSAVGYTLLYGQESTLMSGDRIRAVYHTQKVLDASRAIRDSAFSSVSNGVHGIGISAGKWTYSGSVTTATGLFLSSVNVSQIETDWKRLTARTNWQRGYNRSGSVLITGEVTDWRSTRTIGNWSSLTVDGTYTDGLTPMYTDMDIFSGSYVFATTNNSTGLYVIDTSNTTSPSRINASFSMSNAGYDLAVRGNILYVLTASSTQEIRAYNISSPSTFTSAQLVASYNIPGSGRARSLAISGDMLYVGTTVSAVGGEDEFYAFRLDSNGTMTLTDSLDETGTVQSIALSGTAAYLGSSIDSAELRVINVESGSNLVVLGGYNVSDRTADTISVARSGTAVLLGSIKGTSFEELVLFNTESNALPSSVTGWFEGSGGLLGLDVDPRQCVAFMGIDSTSRAMQVVRIRNMASPVSQAIYNSTSGKGRNVYYDAYRDRLFLLTEQSLLIFRPGAATGTCP